MSTVRDMIRKKGSEVFSIDPDATVYDALAMMSKQNTGALMVVSGCAMPIVRSPTATPMRFAPKSNAKTVPVEF